MLGSWWFGGGPSSPDSNYLRVANAAFPNRRLSDNTLMTPKIRIAPSCASSPGKFRLKLYQWDVNLVTTYFRASRYFLI